ncbi:YihY/virulence factor BrkB family protein [Evansella clarkii]|uniref:YihY/virulence factor BrkB family protein n=1 Tax=Evansella clarkii TaxID=79879 RepID=UPI0009976678|nr:YihY/virulence factor BrkB family protein [Evansella clarkii]
MKFLRSLYIRFKDHGLIDLGAQCSYYLILSLFPFLIFIITLMSFLPFTFEDDLGLISDDIIPSGVLQVVENQWDVITEAQHTGLMSFGILFTLWTASLALNSILRSLNLAYNVTEERGMIKSRFISILLTISMFAVVLVALVLQVIGGAMKEFLAVGFTFFEFDLLRWGISSLILFIVFTLLYVTGPSLRLSLKDVYIGAVFATIGWQLTSLGFTYYLNNFADYTATYGAIGTVIALMVWFHFSSIIVLLGGEINAALKED